MTIVPEGDARVELDCAHGSIRHPFALASDGTFEWTGSFAAEHPGPTRQNDADSGRPVSYRGRVEGDSMTLTVQERGTGEVTGSFILKKGAPGRIRKCS